MSSDRSGQRWRVGYWMTQKKMKKIQFDKFLSKCREGRIDVIELDFDNLNDQLPLHAIIHKLSDFIVHSEQGDSTAMEIIDRVQYFEKCRPEILMFDPIDSVRVLCNRYEQYSLMESLCSEGYIKAPPFILIQGEDETETMQLLKSKNIRFPFVCKPIAAHGAESAHMMQLVFGVQGLSDIETPCVAQQFIAHDGILYKAFVIGDDVFISSRPSLKNFTAGDFATLAFKTKKISKIGSVSSLSPKNADLSNVDHASVFGDNPKEFARKFRRTTGMSLFGMDLIVEQKSNNIYVIDINTFPSYDSVPDFHNALYQFLVKSLTERFSRDKDDKSRGAVDSGLGSSAESDTSDCEKKLKQLLCRDDGMAASFGPNDGGGRLVLYEPDRERLKKYYGIPKVFKSQLCISGSAKNGKGRGRSNGDSC